MATVFKLSLNGDLRRLTTSAAEPAISFADLALKASALFGLSPEGLSFTYTDVDGDVVTLASELDMHELHLQKLDSPIRLTIVQRQPGAFLCVCQPESEVAKDSICTLWWAVSARPDHLCDSFFLALNRHGLRCFGSVGGLCQTGERWKRPLSEASDTLGTVPPHPSQALTRRPTSPRPRVAIPMALSRPLGPASPRPSSRWSVRPTLVPARLALSTHSKLAAADVICFRWPYKGGSSEFPPALGADSEVSHLPVAFPTPPRCPDPLRHRRRLLRLPNDRGGGLREARGHLRQDAPPPRRPRGRARLWR